MLICLILKLSIRFYAFWKEVPEVKAMLKYRLNAGYASVRHHKDLSVTAQQNSHVDSQGSDFTNKFEFSFEGY